MSFRNMRPPSGTYPTGQTTSSPGGPAHHPYLVGLDSSAIGLGLVALNTSGTVMVRSVGLTDRNTRIAVLVCVPLSEQRRGPDVLGPHRVEGGVDQVGQVSGTHVAFAQLAQIGARDEQQFQHVPLDRLQRRGGGDQFPVRRRQASPARRNLVENGK